MPQGIQSLKQLILIPISLAEIAEDSLKDGKIGLGDALAHGPALLRLVNGLIGFDFTQPVKEFADLSDVEKEDLMIFVQKEFDLENDKLEAVAEKVFGLALQTSGLIVGVIEFLKGLKKP